MLDAYLYAVANEVKSMIIIRTTKGRDYQNRKMTYRGKVYSKSYAKYRKENNRTDEVRTLSYRGNMLRSIRPKKIRGGVRLWFPDKAERDKAKKQQLEYKTVFFKLSKNQRSKYVRYVKRFIGVL